MHYTNWSSTSYEKFTKGIMNNEKINVIFTSTDPNVIWPSMIGGMNEFINEEYPTTIIQTRKNHKPYLHSEVDELISEAHEHLEMGIRDQDNDKFRLSL